jgi:hypothetical protein
MRDKILSKLNKESTKKVVMNFNIAKDLKHSFEDSCKYDGVTMSSVLIAMIETYIEDVNESRYADIRASMENMEALKKKIIGDEASDEVKAKLLVLKSEFENYIEEYGDYLASTNSSTVESLIDLNHYVRIINAITQISNKGK